MCVNVSNIHWYVIKHLDIWTANAIIYYYVPETVLCMLDVAVNKTKTVPALMVFVSQSGNQTTIKKAKVKYGEW